MPDGMSEMIQMRFRVGDTINLAYDELLSPSLQKGEGPELYTLDELADEISELESVNKSFPICRCGGERV